MQAQENIISCYNKTANKYAEQFMDELSKKHFDRMLLQAFALENAGNSKMIDLGCGPGQTTRYLSDCGITDIVGTDISPRMVEVAATIHPQLTFETADMLSLPYPDDTFGSAVAFYSIVHFTYQQVAMAFMEIKRVLKNDGQFLFSFHTGDAVVHRDVFLEQEVDIDFYFFETEKIIELLTETGFEVIDSMERHPYKDVEYSSKRAYIWVKKPVS